jgi:hypothetical protein
MAFELKQVVPWGRNLAEYQLMFALSGADLNKQIISFGDGPASFNAEMTRLNKRVISIDPIYQFAEEELSSRIEESREVVMEQTRRNSDNFVWKNIKNIDELERIRMSAMSGFTQDYTLGKQQGRYIYHELPNPLNFADQQFDLGLSSHFLTLYDQLGLEFHIESITEMLRLCKEVRIFPLLNLNVEKSKVLDGIMEFFGENFDVKIVQVDYEFQKGGNQMLSIKSALKA